MTENRSKPFNELPDWEKKLRRSREYNRKAITKENKRQNRCRFIIGKLVGEVFPALLQSDLSEGSDTYKTLSAALAYLKEHPDVYRPCDATLNMCTYTNDSTEGQRNGNV